MIGIDDLKCKKYWMIWICTTRISSPRHAFLPNLPISISLQQKKKKKTGGYITPHHKIVRLDVYRLDQGRIYLDEDETPKETNGQHQTTPNWPNWNYTMPAQRTLEKVPSQFNLESHKKNLEFTSIPLNVSSEIIFSFTLLPLGTVSST